MAAGRGLGLRTCYWVLALLALAMSGASGLANARQRGLRESNYSNKVHRASLMHRDHPASPLSVPSATTESRFHATTARENARIARRGLAIAVEFNTSIVSAKAEGDGEYVMTLYLGTPVQKFVVIVDTGSNLVWVQCAPCIRCYNETDPFFDPSMSSTYSAVSCSSTSCNQTQLRHLAFCNSLNTCEIHYAYAKAGSEYEGVLSTETISFDADSTDSVPNILIGCMNNNTDSFRRVDGFVGFGRRAFSLPSQLSALNSINVFSYCLIPYDVSTTLTSTLVFGVPDTTNDLQLVYTPILNNNYSFTFYWVNMTGIAINGVDVSVSTKSSSSQSNGTFFDSGTSNIKFSQDIYSVVTQNLQELITYPTTNVDNVTICYNVSGVQNVVYPNMTLHFSSLDSTIIADFELSVQNLFISVGDNIDCLAMSTSGAATDGLNIIGNIAQADHYVEIDLENMKIGWTNRDCSLPV